MNQQHCVSRKPWDLAFAAEPEELAALRRITRLHLRHWGLPHLIEAAELCVSEMVSNVITHVGPGTPTQLALSMSGTFLHIEVQDPDSRALPTLISAADDSEAGRGMRLVDAVTDRWGVSLKADRKVTWCELATGVATPGGHVGGETVDRAEALLGLYGEVERLRAAGGDRGAPVVAAVSKATAIDAISDLLCWVHMHGHDADEVLESAELRCEYVLRVVL
ncbi:ATP-binding protein [Streptomyces beihaiensis]|uniref:ATP-binding protein n=1 Tax=Streptomyces beihaiensis TaxID=2984495 RepID=A0ABT3U2T8_9ACTN|nr:ATP-binding protein [Streptomyces beihaiensis]MCX3063638.1 ATP-binding protein [Streptomyces beihaiensis]